MELEYIKVEKKTKKLHDCPYNSACHCRVKNCYNCGWNPKLAKIRMDRILGCAGKG